MPITQITQRTLAAALVASAVAVATITAAPAYAEASATPSGRASQVHDPLLAALLVVKGQLNLDATQQAQWQAAIATSREARQQGRTLRQGLRSTVDAELAKPTPDLQALAAATATAEGEGIALRHRVRDAWLDVYASLSPQQKAIAADSLRTLHAQREDARPARAR